MLNNFFAYQFIPPVVEAGAPAPTVLSINPTTGKEVGGTAYSIIGTGFVSGAVVTFGGVVAWSVHVMSSTQIVGAAPPGTGTVDVVVTNPDSQFGTLTDGFTFIPAPTVTSCVPGTGTTAGGTAVTIGGTGFIDGATVFFGGNLATSIVFVSDTELTCVTPAGTGTVDVEVENLDAQTGTLTDGFVYEAPWTPLDIAGCVLWLDASQITGLSDGDDVGTWEDLSTLGNDAVQATADKKPHYKVNILNSLPVVRFDGSDDFMSTFTTGLTAWSMFFVFARGDKDREQVFFAKPNNSSIDGNFFWMFTGGNALHAGFHNGSAWQWGTPTTNTITDTSGHIGQLDWNATALAQYVDGVLWRTANLTGPPATNTGATEIGRSNAANRYFKGDMGEIVIYNNSISAADLALLETYLSDKWGIAL